MPQLSGTQKALRADDHLAPEADIGSGMDTTAVSVDRLADRAIPVNLNEPTSGRAPDFAATGQAHPPWLLQIDHAEKKQRCRRNHRSKRTTLVLRRAAGFLLEPHSRRERCCRLKLAGGHGFDGPYE